MRPHSQSRLLSVSPKQHSETIEILFTVDYSLRDTGKVVRRNRPIKNRTLIYAVQSGAPDPSQSEIIHAGNVREGIIGVQGPQQGMASRVRPHPAAR